MSALMNFANKSLTIAALVVFSATAAVNGGYERIIELENQRKDEIIQQIVTASLNELININVRSVDL